jgi:hypothetical protein
LIFHGPLLPFLLEFSLMTFLRHRFVVIQAVPLG